jgi:hypothetical protein
VALEGIRNALKELARVPSRVSKVGALEIEKMWRRSYMASQDPYGNELAALKPSTIKKKGHDWIMVDTQETLDSTRVRALPGAGIALRTGKKASWHMQPTANRPARRVLPAFGLPKTWRAKLRAIAEAEFSKAVRG